MFWVLNNLKFVVVRVEEVCNYAAPWHLGGLEGESDSLSFEPFIECIDVVGIENYPSSPFLLDFLPVACKPIFANGSFGPTSAWLNILALSAIGKPRVSW